METAHDSIVWTLAWHPLGHILCSGSNDHTIKFWTRNRPGDLMRDKYNLNTLPASLAALDDGEYDDAIIPGMGPEDKVEFTESLTADKGFIPGLDLDPSKNSLRDQEKKVPYSKPIPRNFQVQWAGPRRADDDDDGYSVRDRRQQDNSGLTPQQVSENAIEGMLASNVLTTMDPQAIVGILVYGRFIRVHPDSRLMLAVRQGPDYLNNYIDAGKLEELRDVVPARDRSRSMSPTLEGRESSPPSKKSRFEPRQHNPQAVFVKELLSLKKPFLPCLLNLKSQQQSTVGDPMNSPQPNFQSSNAGPWANNNNNSSPWNNANNGPNHNGFNNNNNNNNSSNNKNNDMFPNQQNSNSHNNNNSNKSNSNNSNNQNNSNSNRRNRRNRGGGSDGGGGGGGGGGRNRGRNNRRF